jgi:hypothetical protein
MCVCVCVCVSHKIIKITFLDLFEVYIVCHMAVFILMSHVFGNLIKFELRFMGSFLLSYEIKTVIV